MSLYHLVKDCAFYRPYAHGYTDKVAEAGVFTYGEATLHCESSHGEVIMIPAPPKKVTDAEVEVARASLWAAHAILALDALRAKAREFARGVSNKVPQSNEPRVVGFKAEWEALLAEASKPAPELPSSAAVRKTLEDQGS
jgi:hypothetical protein